MGTNTCFLRFCTLPLLLCSPFGLPQVLQMGSPSKRTGMVLWTNLRRYNVVVVDQIRFASESETKSRHGNGTE